GRCGDRLVLPTAQVAPDAKLTGGTVVGEGAFVASEAEKQDGRATRLITRAREVREEELPGDYLKSVVHLRRMGWAVNELHDLLTELEAVKGPDSLKEGGTP
ncbi:DUF6415 family natural product biosynthesis protein, partial [Streptomyces violaceoruber]